MEEDPTQPEPQPGLLSVALAGGAQPRQRDLIDEDTPQVVSGEGLPYVPAHSSPTVPSTTPSSIAQPSSHASAHQQQPVSSSAQVTVDTSAQAPPGLQKQRSGNKNEGEKRRESKGGGKGGAVDEGGKGGKGKGGQAQGGQPLPVKNLVKQRSKNDGGGTGGGQDDGGKGQSTAKQPRTLNKIQQLVQSYPRWNHVPHNHLQTLPHLLAAPGHAQTPRSAAQATRHAATPQDVIRDFSGLRVAVQTGSIRDDLLLSVMFVDFILQDVHDRRSSYAQSTGASELLKDLKSVTETQVDALAHLRPLPVLLGNTVRAVKKCLKDVSINSNTTETDVVSDIQSILIKWRKGSLLDADSTISDVLQDLPPLQTVLIVGYQSSVINFLIKAHQAQMAQRSTSPTRDTHRPPPAPAPLKVFVVSGGPRHTGMRAAKALRDHGVWVCVVRLSAVPTLLVTEGVRVVLLGAAAVYHTGAAQVTAGSTEVAMVAHAAGIPVIVTAVLARFTDKNTMMGPGGSELRGVNFVPNTPNGVCGATVYPYIAPEYGTLPSKYIYRIATEVGLFHPMNTSMIAKPFSKKDHIAYKTAAT